MQPGVLITAWNKAGRAATVDRLFRRALLLAPQDASLQEIADLAEMAHLAGRDDLARLLLACIGLEFGFGADGLSWWSTTGRDTSFWSIGHAAAEGVQNCPQFPAAVAVAGLRELMRIEPDAAKDADQEKQAAPGPSIPALAEWNGRFSVALDRLLDDGDLRIAPFLDALQPEVSTWSPFDLSKYAGETAETLALAIVFNTVWRFAARAKHFRIAPLGSDRLLEAAMRLSGNGLGVLFGNVDALLRDERDIFDWTTAAAPDGMEKRRIEDWRSLLAMNLGDNRWNRFVTQTVRSGRIELIALLLDHLLKQARRNDFRLHHMRDRCLEQGLADFAFAAQRRIAEQRRDDLNEWLILADLAGLMRLDDQVDVLLALCLADHPDDKGLLARRNRLAAGTLGGYVRQHGFFADPVHGPARLTAFRIIPAFSEVVS